MLVTFELPTELEHKLQRQSEEQKIPVDKIVEEFVIKSLDYKQVVELINQLPDHILPELLNFIEYLHFKTKTFQPSLVTKIIAMRDQETLRVLSAPSLVTLMDDIGRQAEANGLTPEILDSLFDEP